MSNANESAKSKIKLDGLSKKSTVLEDAMKLGKYSIRFCFLAEFMIFSQLSNMYYMVYAGRSIMFQLDRCQQQDKIFHILLLPGIAPKITACGHHVYDPSLDSISVCNHFYQLKENITCEPELHSEFLSVNIEFGYLCHESKIVKDSISIQMIGVILGSIVFGHISDFSGRKKVRTFHTMMICLIGITIIGALSVLSTNFIAFTIFRTLIGFFNGGQIAVLLVFMVENLPKKDRLWINILITWSPNIALLAIIAYLCTTWKVLAVVTSLLSIPAIVLLYFVYESPRWLIQQGRIDEALIILKAITRINGTNEISDQMINHVISNERQLAMKNAEKRRNFYIYHLFYTRELAIHTIVLSLSL
ncbi:unnamed protein product [Dracunculus medinensis]|uniref:MFS domain-containing protein n=1 Tax=Dracunculus medinensis TaxID=318479 RepID=A0A0N4UP73_DRAME|nr:unnamed protein product [Dracunculus medinensis]